MKRLFFLIVVVLVSSCASADMARRTVVIPRAPSSSVDATSATSAKTWAAGSYFVLPESRSRRDIAIHAVIAEAFTRRGGFVYADEDRIPSREFARIGYEVFDYDGTAIVYVFVAEPAGRRGYGFVYGIASASRTYDRNRDRAYTKAAKDAATLVAIGGVDLRDGARSSRNFAHRMFVVAGERRGSRVSDQVFMRLVATEELLKRGAYPHWSPPNTDEYYVLRVGGDRSSTRYSEFVSVRVQVEDPRTSQSLVVVPSEPSRTHSRFLAPSRYTRNLRAMQEFRSEVRAKLDWISENINWGR